MVLLIGLAPTLNAPLTHCLCYWATGAFEIGPSGRFRSYVFRLSTKSSPIELQKVLKLAEPTGIEPAFPAWQTSVITTIPRLYFEILLMYLMYLMFGWNQVQAFIMHWPSPFLCCFFVAPQSHLTFDGIDFIWNWHPHPALPRVLRSESAML